MFSAICNILGNLVTWEHPVPPARTPRPPAARCPPARSRPAALPAACCRPSARPAARPGPPLTCLPAAAARLPAAACRPLGTGYCPQSKIKDIN